MARILGGIFVGGAATRFGGIAKGLLPAPDGASSIVARTAALLRAHDVEPVLVGQRAEYTSLDIPMIADPTEGPLRALLALFAHAGERRVLVLACDMPFVESIGRLLESDAALPLVAARRDGRWEPFFSRHDPRVVGPIAEAHAAAGRPRLQALFDAVPAVPLDIDGHELDDWDSPEDRA